MLKLNEELGRHGLIYPGRSGVLPVLAGRRADRHQRLVADRRPLRPHPRSGTEFVHVLPTGEVMRVGDGGGRKITKSSSGYQLKHLFMGHQGTLGIATEATLKLFPKPEAEFSPFWAFDDYDRRLRVRPVRWPARASRPSPARCCSTSGRWPTCAATTRPTSRSRRTFGRWSARSLYGYEDEVRAGGKATDAGSPRQHGARVPRRRDLRGRLGRAGTTATPRRCTVAPGRPGRPDELALRGRRDQLHRSAGRPRGLARDRRRLRARTDVFDDWGMFAYTSGANTVSRLPHRDRHRHLGAATRRRDVGSCGSRRKRDIAARQPSRTAARSAPATVAAARARSTWCRTSSAAAST